MRESPTLSHQGLGPPDANSEYLLQLGYRNIPPLACPICLARWFLRLPNSLGFLSDSQTWP